MCFIFKKQTNAWNRQKLSKFLERCIILEKDKVKFYLKERWEEELHFFCKKDETYIIYDSL